MRLGVPASDNSAAGRPTVLHSGFAGIQDDNSLRLACRSNVGYARWMVGGVLKSRKVME
jgi:hypothetical protein